MAGPRWASVYYYATVPRSVRPVVEKSRKKSFTPPVDTGHVRGRGDGADAARGLGRGTLRSGSPVVSVRVSRGRQGELIPEPWYPTIPIFISRLWGSERTAWHLPRSSSRTARRGSLTPPKPPTEGLHRYGRPSVGRVARSETGHSAVGRVARSETGHSAVGRVARSETGHSAVGRVARSETGHSAAGTGTAATNATVISWQMLPLSRTTSVGHSRGFVGD